MAAIGGSVEDISIGGRLFPVAADADATRRLGGFDLEYSANGDGGARKIKTRSTWQVDGLTVVIDDARGDLEFLQSIADGDADKDFTMTLASGATWGGSGSPTGEIQGSSQSATAAVTFGGPGKLEQQ